MMKLVNKERMMELLHKLEQKVLKWTQKVQHLPAGAQKWLGDNVWWIVLVAAILGGISILSRLIRLFVSIAEYNSPSGSYYIPGEGVTAWDIVIALVWLVFAVASVVLMAMAVQPLQKKEKKGWVLLFVVWILSVVYVVINALLTFNPFSFIFVLIFGFLFSAVSAYFLFEIHGEFGTKTKRRKVTAKKA